MNVEKIILTNSEGVEYAIEWSELNDEPMVVFPPQYDNTYWAIERSHMDVLSRLMDAMVEASE